MKKRTSAALALLALTACGDDAVSAEGGSTSDSSSSSTSVNPTVGPDTSTTDEPEATTSGVGEASTTGGGEESTTEGGEESTTGDPEACGDGALAGDEACDDGNTDPDDGCSDVCQIEDGFLCDDAEPTICTAECGDGMVVGAEQCDDGALQPGDGCDDQCIVELGWSCDMEPSVCMTGCGDGIAAGMEACDDGGIEPDDGCTARCTIEDGWVCDDASPTVCMGDCGDSVLVGDETCDDGGSEPGDGCDDLCSVEPGYVCEGEPSLCATDCGDGVMAGLEVCDDGNIAQGDGCSEVCATEFPFSCAGTPSVCTITETLADVALGFEGGCVLTLSGTVACFGNNTEGQVGNGTIDVETFLPVPVFEGAQQVSAGDEHVCAVNVAGEVWCWGDNNNLQMGPTSTMNVDELVPVEITGLPVIVAVEAGDDHTCALDGVGSVWCWGDNDNRQLGRGGAGTVDDANPATVDLGQPATDLGLGENHSCAVLADATVACWGDDDGGQLGDGTAGTDSGDPAAVVGLTGAVNVEAGRDATCAIDDAGGVWCWGNNDDGELGLGNTTDTPTATSVSLPAAADAIALGDNFACTLLTNEEVYCWGNGSNFKLGYGNLISQPSPVQVLDMPPGDIVDLEAGDRGACALLSTGERWCWGYSEEGQLGIAPLNQLDLTTPLTFSGPLASLHLARPEYRGNVCGVLMDGTVECAGEGSSVLATTTAGAAGIFNGITRNLSVLTQNPGLVDAQTLALGDSSICFATSTNVQCFGDNSNRQLGQGGTSTVDIVSPSAVPGLGIVDELDAGSQFYCARQGGTISCWGDNDNFQTGDDTTTTDQSVPTAVPMINDALDMELGEAHGCALRTGGVVSCWGDDGVGQLGDDDGSTSDSGTPVDVTGLPAAASQLVVGQDHGCALVDAEVYCWGENGRGQLGQGDTLDSDTALLVPDLPPIVTIASGFNYTCAIDDTAEMWCWGYGLDGQLGNGGEALTGVPDFLSPVHFDVASGITNVVAGNSTTCVETMEGWQCLGFRSSGQLADDTTLEPCLPHPMMFGI